MTEADSVIMKQAGILSLAAVLDGLSKVQDTQATSDLYERISKILEDFFQLCKERGRVLGVTLLCRAANVFIKLVSPLVPSEFFKVSHCCINETFKAYYFSPHISIHEIVNVQLMFIVFSYQL